MRVVKSGNFWWGVVATLVVSYLVLPYVRSMTAARSSGG